MAKILVVYGSTTGNTEWTAKEVAKLLGEAGHETTVKNVTDVKADGLCQGYDLVAFGASTWGTDELEFQEDFTPFFENFDKLGANGVKTAVFGCGDDSYEYYCGAVDAMADKLAELGSTVVGGKLKINGDPEEASADIEAWAKSVAGAI